MIPSKSYGDPSHHPSAEELAQRMFFVFVVERVEDGDGHFGVAHIACRGLLLPEAIPGAKIEQVVTADARVGDRNICAGKSRERCKRIGYRIFSSSHMIEKKFAA